MSSVKSRNFFITAFVILWLFIFHYVSLRYFYLNPLFKRDMPKLKFLFPPAGWIMFYEVGDQYGYIDVYGIYEGKLQLIDPHAIFRTRTFGFDNIHRGILGSAARREMAQPFCQFLQRRFPKYEKFLVVQAYYPSITQEPAKRYEEVLYQCTGAK